MSLRPRSPQPEWAWRAARGELPDLAWVDATIETHRQLYRMTEDDGGVRFQAVPYSHFAPPVMTEAAAEAQRGGQATLQEALILLLARPEWMIATRDRLWTPTTAFPPVLARLTQAYGIGPALHRLDPDVLVRLVALLPSWYPRRGSLSAARQVLTTADRPEKADGAAAAVDRPTMTHEVMAIHSLAWWEARVVPGAAPAYRIERGHLLFQPASAFAALRREDVLVPLSAEPASAGGLARLLPPWAVLRPTLLAPEAQP